MRKQFTFYASFFEAIAELPDGSREAVYDAVCAFALRGERRELPELAQRVALKLIMPNLVSSRAKALAAQGKSGDPANIGRNKKEDKNKKENKNELETETETETESEAQGHSQGLQEAPERTRLQREFYSFWEEYPVKLGEDAAWSLWLETKPCLSDMLEALRQWKQSPSWTEDGGRYIPQAKKFIAEGYAHQKPPQPKKKIPYGGSGKLGEEEMEAIRRMMGGSNDPLSHAWAKQNGKPSAEL